MVLPQPLRKQASLSAAITAFMVLKFRPDRSPNNKELHYWPDITLFSFKAAKTEKHQGILMGILA